MAHTVVNLPRFTVATTAATATNSIGSLDDAASITVFFTSSSAVLTSGTIIQVSQFDPAIATPSGVTQSTGWQNVTSSNVYSSASAVVLTNVSFRGLRLNVLASANTAGEVVAYVSKEIRV